MALHPAGTHLGARQVDEVKLGGARLPLRTRNPPSVSHQVTIAQLRLYLHFCSYCSRAAAAAAATTRRVSVCSWRYRGVATTQRQPLLNVHLRGGGATLLPGQRARRAPRRARTVKMACDRDECAFIAVDAVDRASVPSSMYRICVVPRARH